MKYTFIVFLFVLFYKPTHAQVNDATEAKSLSFEHTEEKATKVNKMDGRFENMPTIVGLPDFFVSKETSLRVAPDHRSKVKIRLYPGTEVEILDPSHNLHWTKIRIGERIGWAKKALLHPVSGQLDYSYLEALPTGER